LLLFELPFKNALRQSHKGHSLEEETHADDHELHDKDDKLKLVLEETFHQDLTNSAAHEESNDDIQCDSLTHGTFLDINIARVQISDCVALM